MVRLHARDDAQRAESRNVRRRQVLGVLDAEAAVARTVLARHALEDVEQRRVGPIADRVNDHVQAGLVGAGDPAVEILWRRDEQAALAGRVGERVVKGRRVRSERSVDEPLERADAQPGVAAPFRSEAFRGDGVPQSLPAVQRNRGVDSRGQAACARGAVEHGEIVPRPHVVDGRDSLRRDVAHRGLERAILQRIARRRHLRRDEIHRVVFEDAGQLAPRVADDLAARDIRRLARHPGGAERGRVGQRHVAVEPVDPDGMVRRGRIDPVAARQLVRPSSVWSQSPPVIHVPAGTVAANAVDARDERLARRGIPELDGREPEPAIEEVNVGIDEAGHDEPAAEIHDLGAVGTRADVGRAADRDDSIAGDDDRFGFGLRGVAGPDPAVDERQRDHGASGVAAVARPRGSPTVTSTRRRVQPMRYMRPLPPEGRKPEILNWPSACSRKAYCLRRRRIRPSRPWPSSSDRSPTRRRT